MNDLVAIRHANASEIFEISKVLVQSWKFAYKGIVNDQYLSSIRDDHWVDILRTGLADENSVYLVAKENERLAGVCVLRKSQIKEFPEDCEIVSIYLLPTFIGKGMGFQLYRFAEAVMKQKGYSHCVLGVLSENSRAIGFYKKAGFEQTDCSVSFILGTQTLGCNIMRKIL